MKNIFTPIEYVAEKIKEAITGHQNDEQAHPNLSEQINVLKGKVEWKARNWKSENALPSEFQAETQTMFYSNDSTWNGKRYVIIRVSKYTDTTVFQEVLDCNTGSVIMYRCSSTSEKWTTWETIATTTKTDILLLGQWQKGIGDMNQYASKTGNTVTVNASIKGGISDENTVIFALPDGFKPNSNIVIAGAKNWSKEEVARFITVRTNGEVILRSGFNSSDTYILDFSFSIN